MSTLEEVLGHSLPADARGTIPSLNDLPPELLAEAKALADHAWPLAVRYLRFYVVRSDKAPDFCEEVLAGGADPATWGTRDLLCGLEAEMAELLSYSVSEVIERLRALPGERWFRMAVPSGPATWDGTLGLPGVLVRAARYWWSAEGFTSLTVYSPLEQIADADLPVAIRRWMALRMTWWAREYLAQGAPTFGGLVAAVAGGADVAPTNDARIAIAALLRELQTPGDGRPLGFRGPDEWYRSP